TNIISPVLNNDFRLNLTQNNITLTESLDAFGGAQPFDISQVPGFGSSGFAQFGLQLRFNGGKARVFVGPQQDAQRQWNATDALIFNHRAHTFKFGIDYRRLATFLRNRQISEGGIFSSMQGVLNNTPSSLVAFSDALTPPEPLYTNFS